MKADICKMSAALLIGKLPLNILKVIEGFNVKCIDEFNLTTGSLYQVKGLTDNGMLIVDDDNGNEKKFASERFEFV